MSFAGSLALRASCSLGSCSPSFVLPSGFAEWVRMEGDTSFSLSGSTEDPSAEDIDLDELSNDNSRAPLDSLGGSKLELSTVISSLGGPKGSETQAVTLTQMFAAKKTCVFCRHTYVGGPRSIRSHLDSNLKKHNRPCTPSAPWFHRHAQVLKVLRERAQAVIDAADLQAKKAKAKSLVSDNAVAVVGPGTIQAMRVSTEEVNEQRMRAFVGNGLAMHIVDDPEFRAAITMTARAGNAFVDAFKGDKGDCRLPHKTYMMEKQLPLLDDKLHERVSKKIK